MLTAAHPSASKMSSAVSKPDPRRSLLCAVLEDEGIALVRVEGRGSFTNSMTMKSFATYMTRRNPALRLILDLRHCDSMDSTFMGVLAGLALEALRAGREKLILVNVGDHCYRLLRNLGILSLIDIRRDDIAGMREGEKQLEPMGEVSTSRLDQICLTLQAHRELVEIDKQNELRFQAVIEYLEKSLQEEKDKGRP